MTNNIMFPLIMRNDPTDSLNAYKDKDLNESWLWHLTYGNLHFGGLDLLQKKEMVKGLHNIQQPTNSCKSCIVAKHHMDTFIYGVSCMAKAPLELFHIDLCGPMQTLSLNGNVYFITFIDDFSQKTWVYLLKQKSEDSDIFKRFKVMFENESGKYIKVLILDREGEYILTDFMEFCWSHAIKRQFTIHYTPRQNGVVERKNQTIINMA
jgi:hypothetical protein